MLRVVGILLVLAVYIYFIIDVLRTPRTRVRTLPKAVWFLVVVIIPIVGGVLWFFLGRVRPENGGFFRKRGPVAPDDDPRFLRKLDEDVWSAKMRKRRGENPT